MALSTIPTRALSEQGINFRNLIINGDMSIAQRGTSFTGLTNGSSEYTLDRFKFIESGSPTSVFTVSQESTAPDGFSNSLKIACTTSGSGHNVIEIIQSIEAQNLKSLAFGTSSAKSFTLSFWVKSNQTGTGTVSFYNLDALRQRAENYTINVADTWEYKTITVSGDTSGAFNNDNGIGLTVYFPIAASVSYNGGSTGSWGSYSDGKRGAGMTIDLTTSTSDYLQITGVQLEVGTSASDFEFLPYDVNKQRCSRYYQNSFNIGNVPGVSTNNADAIITTGWNDGNAPFPPFKVEMRASPTITLRPRNSTTTGQVSNNNVNRNASATDISNKGVAYLSITSGTALVFNAFTFELDAEL